MNARSFNKEVALINRKMPLEDNFVDHVWAWRIEADRIELFGCGGKRYFLRDGGDLELDF